MLRRDFLASAGLLTAAGLMAGPIAASPAAAGVSLENAAAFAAARRFVHVPQGDIAFVERGAGRAALFLHGFPLNGYQWRGAIERLWRHRRCIAPDLLGLGYTRVADGQGVAPADQVPMLVALLDALGVDQVDLVANDSGGAVAQLFAVAHPARVRTLLLTNCDTEIDCPPPALLPVLALAREGRFVSEWLSPWLRDPVLARSPQGLGGMTYTFPQHPTDEALQTYLSPLVADPARTHAYALGLASNVLAGVEAPLKALRVPARIVWGTGDPIFTARAPDYLHGILDGSRGVRRIDDAKLFFPEEFPDIIAEEALALWRAA